MSSTRQKDIALLWDTDILFKRYLKDCGFDCELLTPIMLSSPLFPLKYKLIIVSAGFGDGKYSKMLKALRINRDKIEEYIKEGGRILTFSSLSESMEAYDWLPILGMSYRMRYGMVKVEVVKENKASMIIENDVCECDGYLMPFEGEIVMKGDDKPLLVVKKHGKGEIILTTIHEYPSKRFIEYYVKGIRDV